MSKVTAEMLSAFHDRELELEQTFSLRSDIAANSEARSLLESYDRIDDAVKLSLAEDLDAPISLDLARTVRAGFAKRERRNRVQSVMRWVGPIAASIVVVMYGNNMAQQRANEAMAQRELQIAALTDQAVQKALESALSGALVSLADEKLSGVVSITPTRTYLSETENWCREFVEKVVIDDQETTRYGLACREKTGGWHRVQTRLPGSTPPPVGQVL